MTASGFVKAESVVQGCAIPSAIVSASSVGTSKSYYRETARLRCQGNDKPYPGMGLRRAY